VLKEFRRSVCLEDGYHLPLARKVDALQQFKAFKAVVLAAIVEVADEFSVAGQLAIDIGEGSDDAIKLHCKKAWSRTLWPERCSMQCSGSPPEEPELLMGSDDPLATHQNCPSGYPCRAHGAQGIPRGRARVIPAGGTSYC
jgi:hypothetical protein